LLDQDVGSGQSCSTWPTTGPRVVPRLIPISALDRVPPDAEVGLALRRAASASSE